MPDPFVDPLSRKLEYVKNLASIPGINLTMLKWEFILPKIEFNISFNVDFKFNIDLNLAWNFHFELPQLEFLPPQFEKIEKARYGISKYGKAIYDPEQVTSERLDQLVWDTRYKTTEIDCPCWKYTGNSLLKYIQWIKDSLTPKGVKEEYLDGILGVIGLVEGQLLYAGYVGFSIVGLASVCPPLQYRGGFCNYHYSKFKVRSFEDWNTEIELETIGVFQNWVGISRVGYCRVVADYATGRMQLPKELANDLSQRILDFWKRVGQAPITKGLDTEVPPEIEEITKYCPPVKSLIYQRVFWYQRVEKMHWEGGKHQLRLQTAINEVKRLLNQAGVPGMFRMPYIQFAQEIFYQYYTPGRACKQWKKMLTEDDILEKYKRMGCNVELLQKIKEVMVRWRTPEMQPE